ncbi:MAG TPA: hypothetical protein VHQ90_24530 [Thermoanaerobaculia bacterium]|nr:hypothetical protein [Thermoanaerobaculia bacterium]
MSDRPPPPGSAGEPAPAGLPADSRKELCRELAALLATAGGLRAARLLQENGVLQAPHGAASAADIPDTVEPAGQQTPATAPRPAPRPISIWQPRVRAGESVWVRPDPLPLGDHFASRLELAPKRAPLPLRVCLFGESTAAGYLYAPHLTPAQVLEAQLRAVAGAGACEVIDLARTNETLPGLVETLLAAVQIQPDVVVLFAGNNWNLLETPEVSPYVPSTRARQRYALALREAGVAGPVRLAEERLRQRAESACAEIAAIAAAVGIPVVVVVPEVNLADWQNRQPVPWLPGGATARWYALYRRALRRLARRGGGRSAAAAAAAAVIATAREMQRLDGGLCPTTWRLLAEAAALAGDLPEARRASLAEIDAAAYATQAFLAAPQAGSAPRELLRRAAAVHGWACVDLPAIFAEHTGSPLPGRRLFLDYCHLTREGMHLAMAAVAAEVLRLSGLEAGEPDWRTLAARLPQPAVSPEIDATAMLGAAIHGAHRLLSLGAKASFLEPWCEAALDASSGVEVAMFDLLAARCAPCPAVLTAAQQRNLASPYRLGLAHGWRYDHLDADLIEAIVTVLERRGRPARREATRQLLAHHGIRRAGSELAIPPLYHWEPLERFYPDVMSFEDLPQRGTHRSPWPEATYCLVCDGESDVGCELTLRLPALPGTDPANGSGEMREAESTGGQRGRAGGESRVGGRVRGGTQIEASRRAGAGTGRRRGRVGVLVNGVPVAVFAASEHWTRAAMRIGREHLRPGLNRLTLRWPAPPPHGEAALRTAVERLELGLAADIHPVFGEVFSFLARPC